MMENLLRAYDEWEEKRRDLGARDSGSVAYAEETGKSEDDWEPVRFGEWANSDAAAVELLRQIAAELRNPTEVQWLTVEEIAKTMRVSKMTVYRLCSSGDLPCVRMGNSFRVAERDLLAYLARTA